MPKVPQNIPRYALGVRLSGGQNEHIRSFFELGELLDFVRVNVKTVLAKHSGEEPQLFVIEPLKGKLSALYNGQDLKGFLEGQEGGLGYVEELCTTTHSWVMRTIDFPEKNVLTVHASRAAF